MTLTSMRQLRSKVKRRKYEKKFKGMYIRKAPRMLKGLNNPKREYFYKYIVIKPIIGIGHLAQTSQGALEFKLQDIPNYAELTSLYDEYCISKVVVKFYPKFGQVGQVQGGGNLTVVPNSSAMKAFVTAIDYDDSNTPPSRADLIQWGTARMHTPTSLIKRVLTPCIAVQTYKTVASSGYSAKPLQWVDCGDDTVPHYGVKYQAELEQPNTSGATLSLYDVICTYYVKFRGTR